MTARSTLRDDYLAALLAGDATRARWLVDQAVQDGAEVRTVYLEVLQPALETVGELWADGELTVAHEHYATQVTQGIMGVIAPLIRRPPDSGRLAVVTATPGEQHALGALMLADFVEGEGWEVLALGAATPAPDLAALVDDERPDLVALSTSVPDNVPAAEEVVTALREADPPPFVVVGGRAWRGREERAREVGADACLPDAHGLTAVLRERFPPLPEE